MTPISTSDTTGPVSGRDARFDLIRVVAMLMIIFGHLVFHNIRDIHGSGEELTVEANAVTITNYALCQLLTYCSIIGPNLFMLITGYFLINPRSIGYSLRKATGLWTDIAIYSAGIYGVAAVAGMVEFESGELLGYLLPVHSRVYWFLTVYLAVLLLSPFLAKASRLSKQEYQILLAILLIIYFAQEEIGYGAIFSGGMSLTFFVFVFLTGGYLRLFDVPAVIRKHSGAMWLAICLVLTLLCVAPRLGSDVLVFHIKGMANNSLPYFMSVLCFIAFMNIPVRDRRLSMMLTGISPYILSVYLIHEHPLIRQWLWTTLFDAKADVGQWWFIPYALIISASILLACVAIDYLCRLITFHRSRHRMIQKATIGSN